MRSIAKLFGHSPFVPIQIHMEKVAFCVDKVETIIEAFLASDNDRVGNLSQEISSLEHSADGVKHDIQNQLRKKLFMPVDRARLLEIIWLQDSIADKAENLGILLTLKPLKKKPPFLVKFREFLNKNLETFQAVKRVISELDELLETSFGGAEAQKVFQMVHEVAVLEHQADRIQHDLLKELFAYEDEMTYGEFFLWIRIFKQIGELANLSEGVANKVRNTLQLK